MALVFLVIAVVLFILAALGVQVSHVNLVAWGLASLALSFAVGTTWPWVRRP